MPSPGSRTYRFLRFLERYTKTDMVYLANSGFWLNLNVIIVTLLSFLLSIAFANLLPAETYGTYQYLLSLSTVVGALTLTGMNYAVTTAVAKGHDGVVRESIRLQVRWSLVPFLISAIVGAYYLYQGNMLIGLGLVVIGILVPLINTFNTYAAYLNGKKMFRQAFVYATVLNAAYYVSIFAGVLYLKDALALLLVNLGVNAAVVVLLYIRTLRRYPPNATGDAEALGYGNHLSGMNAFTIMVRQADALLVFHFLGPAILAVYAFASLIPERIGGLFKFLFFAGLPKFATQSRESITSSLLPKLGKATLAGIVLAGVYALIAPHLFALLFPQYLAAVPYTQLYALVIITGAGHISLSVLTAQQMKARLYVFNTLSPIFQLVLQVALLILFGLWGLLVARIIANIFDTLLATALILKDPRTA